MKSNNRLLSAIYKKPLDATPVWLMRQAGRYLPEYRKIRASAGSFMKLCKTPDLACEVTLQPLKRFALDAAILFSDILTIPDAMGLGLHFKEGEGPIFEKPIRTSYDIEVLKIPQPEEDLSYVLEAIKLIQNEIGNQLPLIGFCGSPWTVAAYMIEGRGHSTFQLIQEMLQKEPVLLDNLLEKLTKAITLHLTAQINAGVDVVMVFDTWGGILNTTNYLNFSLNYIKKIFKSLPSNIPKIMFTKHGNQWIKYMMDAGCDVIGLDWEIELGNARDQIQDKIALQGNLNPKFLYEADNIIEKEIRKILQSYGNGSGHIFNLGHGVPQDVLPEKIEFVVNTVHAVSKDFHGTENA